MVSESKTLAWQEIEMCCQTLCHKEHVIRYIKELEAKNEFLEQQLTAFKHSIAYTLTMPKEMR